MRCKTTGRFLKFFGYEQPEWSQFFEYPAYECPIHGLEYNVRRPNPV